MNKPKASTGKPAARKSPPKTATAKTPPKKATPKTPSTTKPKESKKPTISESAIRNSQAFREATSKAESYANDPERLRKLFEDATKKSRSIPKGPFAETWAYLMAMLRLIRAYYTGAYREIPWQSLVLIIIAVIYFVSPIDLIPDWIPVIGLIDDAFVVGLVLKSVKDDLDAFMEWETSNNNGAA